MKKRLILSSINNRVHFIGIGGSGLGGIAKILMNKGYKVTGSDLIPNIITKNLSLLGVKIFFYHCSKNIQGAHIIVKSTAISQNNPEVLAAKKNKIPVFSRAELLSELMIAHYGIAVSGTHGKTTTTSIIASIFLESGLDPTFINGGFVKSIGSNAYLGNSDYIIVEADESDASFLYLNPKLSIVTNIEPDHMNTYGCVEKLKKTFLKFLNNLSLDSIVVICIDDIIVREILPKINNKVITYGFRDKAHYKIINYNQSNKKGYFQLLRYNKPFIKITLNIPGIHNAQNATAAIATAVENQISKKNIINALKNFQGTKRRFDILGEYYLEKIPHVIKNSTILIDDYGHHPTELNVTIQTIRTEWPNKKLIMIFQPHRYTRTRDLFDEFVSVLSKVDTLLLLDVYPAGECPILGFDSKSLCKSIFINGKIKPIFISNYKKIFKILSFCLTGNDVVLIQGAGDISSLAEELAKKKLKL